MNEPLIHKLRLQAETGVVTAEVKHTWATAVGNYYTLRFGSSYTLTVHEEDLLELAEMLRSVISTAPEWADEG